MTEQKGFKEVIWTDNERTRFILWEAYEGFVDHFNKYMMFQSVNVSDPVIVIGLNRYANYFYEEVRCFLPSFQKKFQPYEVDRINLLFETNKEFTKKDFIIMRRFFADFMHVSGIKNIIMTKDNRSNYEKERSKLGIKDE